jgi:hypothetical protein
MKALKGATHAFKNIHFPAININLHDIDTRKPSLSGVVIKGDAGKVHGVWPPSPDKLAAGPEEYEFDEGTFNYNAKSIVQEANMTLF